MSSSILVDIDSLPQRFNLRAGVIGFDLWRDKFHECDSEIQFQTQLGSPTGDLV